MMQNLSNIKTFSLNTFIFSLFVIFLPVFQGDSCATTKSAKGMLPVVQDKKIKDYEKRLAKLLTPLTYRYNPAGKPDPFMPFFRTSTSTGKNAAKASGKRNRSIRCTTPLECMDVGQLTLVGIVLEQNGSPLAMVQDASGIGYTLKPGMRIGFQHGKVTKIEKEKVIIKEQIENLKGELTSRERILFLHPEESNEVQ